MSSDESEGQDFSDMDMDGEDASLSGEELSGSDFDGDDGMEIDSSDEGQMDHYGSDSDDSEDVPSSKSKKGSKSSLKDQKTKKSVEKTRRTENESDSDSVGSEPLSDTEYAYSRPNLSHIRNKERNTWLNNP